ncbi:MAG: hypothetical protein WD533_00225 [Dehalococcoidia bacterium]
MTQLLEITNEPKVLELERTDDGRFRLVITLSKLGQVTKLDFFLNEAQALEVSQALGG